MANNVAERKIALDRPLFVRQVSHGRTDRRP